MTTHSGNVSDLAAARNARVPAQRSVQGTLALELAPQSGPDLGPPTADGALLPLAGADVVPVGAATRREVQQCAATFSQACVEAVLGDRPVSQLVRWTTSEIHEEITHRAGVVSRARVSGGRRRGPVVRPQVCSLRTCFLSDEVAEVTVRVRYGQRHRCLAARMERISGRWQCTALEFG